MLRTLQEITRHPLFIVVLGITILVTIGSTLIIFFESEVNNQFLAMGDAIWWAVVTMTTVGYGDKVPVTPVGRIIGIVIMFFGMALISLFTATVSSIFVTRKIKEGRGLEAVKYKDHLVICGWNFNGEQVLANLLEDNKKAGSIILINHLPEETVSDSYTGYLLASHILSPGVPQAVDLLFSDDVPVKFQRFELPVQEVGKTYKTIKDKVETAHDFICIGFGRETEAVNLADILSDDYSYLDQFIKTKFEQAGRGFREKSKINVMINPGADTVLEDTDFLIVIGN